MDKESIVELQKIDCNCNDCRHMIRDLVKYRSFDKSFTNEKGQVTSPSFRINYGDCKKYNKSVSFIPNVCQPETQHCFEHRRN